MCKSWEISKISFLKLFLFAPPSLQIKMFFSRAGYGRTIEMQRGRPEEEEEEEGDSL